MPRARFNLRRPAVCWQAIRLGGRTRRNAKARSERAFAERFEGGSKRLSNMAHPAGFEPTTPPSETNAVQESWLAASVQKCL